MDINRTKREIQDELKSLVSPSLIKLLEEYISNELSLRIFDKEPLSDYKQGVLQGEYDIIKMLRGLTNE